MRKFLVPVCIFSMLTGCEQMQTQETAQHALRVFCAAHRNEIIQTLLTPEQQRAGQIVCASVGMSLGN